MMREGTLLHKIGWKRGEPYFRRGWYKGKRASWHTVYDITNDKLCKEQGLTWRDTHKAAIGSAATGLVTRWHYRLPAAPTSIWDLMARMAKLRRLQAKWWRYFKKHREVGRRRSDDVRH